MDSYDYWKTTPPRTWEELEEEAMEMMSRADYKYDMEKHDER